MAERSAQQEPTAAPTAASLQEPAAKQVQAPMGSAAKAAKLLHAPMGSAAKLLPLEGASWEPALPLPACISQAALLALPASLRSSEPLNSPPAAGKLLPSASSPLFFSMASRASLWAASSWLTGPDTVKDLGMFALGLTLAEHWVFSQMSCRSAAVRVPDSGVGPNFPSRGI